MATTSQTTKQRAAEIGATLPQDYRNPEDVVIKIEFLGHPFEVDTHNWTLKVQHLMEQGAIGKAAFHLLSADEYEFLTEYPLSATKDFFTALGKARQAGA
ncbi:hypothetical protein [Glutamicibacter sp. NPDC087583]|uniref:hypothetical protein n=1 Tax=Glutamicibacter sp. NPDC087583 TaxID=3363995 RepID=UPI003827D050